MTTTIYTLLTQTVTVPNLEQITEALKASILIEKNKKAPKASILFEKNKKAPKAPVLWPSILTKHRKHRGTGALAKYSTSTEAPVLIS